MVLETECLIIRNMTEKDFDVLYCVPSYQTAISWGCKQVDEFKDEVNEITKVFAISREEWSMKGDYGKKI